ncbi:hypothetical protein [Taklimakanibacter lacteus]|uniref:hypothetical protein n=1 Tax=Taklimakanibacter lacteus TaxID=2268456 RepID=UPI000E67455A
MTASPFKELAAVVCGNNGPRILALLRAYLDASNGGGIYAVGGFIGRESDWSAVEPIWKEALATFRLGDDFHLAEIVPNLGHEKGSLCILHFSKIMGRSNLHGIGASCEIAHWQTRDTGYENPYHFCFSMALNILREEAGLEYDGEPVALVIDDDVQPHDLTEAIFAAYQKESGDQFASLTFGSRKRFQPIQCSDLAVGALRKEWLEGLLSHKQEAIRQYLGAIGPKARFTHFSAETERMVNEVLNRT